MKKMVLWVAALAVCAAFAGCANDASSASKTEPSSVVEKQAVKADYPYYDSLAALSQKADCIVRGTVVSSSVKTQDSYDATVYEIQLNEIKKGTAAKGDKLQVSQPGTNAAESSTGTTSEFVPLEQGKEYVFFLQGSGSAYYFLNPNQSCYVYQADAAKTDTMQAVLASGQAGFSLTYDAYEALK